MQGSRGFTLMEMLIVLFIIAMVAVLAMPNFTIPMEQGRSLNAKNNLMAIYTAEKNYFNNNGTYDLNIGGYDGQYDPNGVSLIDTALSLNIQDDGTYLYYCGADPSGFACTASRALPSSTAPNNIVIKVTNVPIQTRQFNPNPNPSCGPTTAANYNWCT